MNQSSCRLIINIHTEEKCKLKYKLQFLKNNCLNTCTAYQQICLESANLYIYTFLQLYYNFWYDAYSFKVFLEIFLIFYSHLTKHCAILVFVYTIIIY